MNKEQLLIKCEVIQKMTETEGVRQLAEVVMELIEGNKKKPIGFKNEKKK